MGFRSWIAPSSSYNRSSANRRYPDVASTAWWTCSSVTAITRLHGQDVDRDSEFLPSEYGLTRRNQAEDDTSPKEIWRTADFGRGFWMS
jgi:hypothetical protein